MELKPLRRKHPKGFWVEFRSLKVDVLFKKRDNWKNGNDNPDHDFCVYGWLSPWGKFYYHGMGRYREIDWTHCRAVSHYHDMVDNTVNEDWVCVIFCVGLTSLEAHIMEAQMILFALETNRLSKRGQYVWDRESLINKRQERKYERMIEEYLNLDGNNDWETLRREINGYQR